MSKPPSDRLREAKVEMAENRDFDGPPWSRLIAMLQARLDQLREENDSGDQEATARRRGRIAEVKWLLNLGQEMTHLEQQSPDGRVPFGISYLEIDA